ncbi:hypothetical protein BESB_012300 [Besnoitia besnoiti]|uniref:Uncharacterized protein n=1 Tax=Besnoitia besnoiti TaxID=94643 RepID=A0A2A9M293_BESBE|nr:hypothetical protein BESB_012300 [Besnoitia besnoiti]PFH32618.1 hypothetical protein BESB_012300 [Besnoitia besnoiti]
MTSGSLRLAAVSFLQQNLLLPLVLTMAFGSLELSLGSSNTTLLADHARAHELPELSRLALTSVEDTAYYAPGNKVQPALTPDQRRLSARPLLLQQQSVGISGAQHLRLTWEKPVGTSERNHTDSTDFKKIGSASLAFADTGDAADRGDVARSTDNGREVKVSQAATRTSFPMVEGPLQRKLYLRPPQLPSDISATEMSTFLARLKGSPLLFYGPFDDPNDPTVLTAAALEASTYWSNSIENLRTILDVLYTGWEQVVLLPFSVRAKRSSTLKGPSNTGPVAPTPGTPQPNPAPSPGNPQLGPSPAGVSGASPLMMLPSERLRAMQATPIHTRD